MTVNAETLDHCKRVRYYRQNANGALLALGYDLVTIDGEQFYEPYTELVDESGQTQSGEVSGMVILARSCALPRAPEGEAQDTYGVWEYHGV